jgi:membrane protein EpsK
MTKAVDNAFLNFTTNVIRILVAFAVSMWMTPYLIGKLGIEVYGVVPLFTSALGYLALLTMVLSESANRYVSLSYYKGDIDQANLYLSSAFRGLMCIFAFIMLGAVGFTPFLGKVFSIPSGHESEVRALFLLVIVSSLIAVLNGLYGRSCFLLHKFYWLDLFGVFAKILQVAVLVLGFTYFSKSLIYVGWGAVASSLFVLLLTALLDRFILPELKINYGRFDYIACKKMIRMGIEMSVNQFGALLYLNSDLILINIFLGSTATGQYGAIVQLTVIIETLASVVTRLFGPLSMELIALHDFETLKSNLFTLIKFLGLILGLPVFLLCGFSKPFLSLWLGDEFIGLYPLVVLLVMGQIIPQSLGTLFGIFKGLNTLKIPGIVTIVVGIINILLAIFLIKYTSLGIYGTAIAALLAVFGKNVMFNIMYLSKLIKFKPWKMWFSIIVGCSPAVIFTLITFELSSYIDLNDWVKLSIYGLAFSVVYVGIVFAIVLNRAERLFVVRVLKLDKVLSPVFVAALTM